MPTFTTSIQLLDASEKDYKILQHELEMIALEKNQSLNIYSTKTIGEKKYNWQGDVTIEKIANTIFRAAPKTKKKYSFSIVKNKYPFTYFLFSHRF